eukprot:TRINITY_DN9241_c0_g2_i1.p1 TRINITY_DN9241_c0_g2~~TRINITY_DN9241_c0_g2_i1.p1  ORF type:complete len:185 (+),score=17.17 TRINITY_DN9241_c0_g2_i1:128-682(+)
MGNLCGPPGVGEVGTPPEQRQQHKNVARTMKELEKDNQDVVSLLLLGAGESGKSTIFKQLRSLYGSGYSDDEWRDAGYTVARNTLESITNLLYAARGWEYDSNYVVGAEHSDSRQFILDAERICEQNITAEMAYHIKRLWTDPAIQNTYARRSEFQLPDSAKYFLEKELMIFHNLISGHWNRIC